MPDQHPTIRAVLDELADLARASCGRAGAQRGRSDPHVSGSRDEWLSGAQRRCSAMRTPAHLP